MQNPHHGQAHDRLKPSLALRLLNKALFYISTMLRGKHCPCHIAIMGVIDAFEHWVAAAVNY